MGAGNRSAIGTLVERSTRHLTLVHLGPNRTAEGLRAMPSSTWSQSSQKRCGAR
jgi:hypothetical protein